MTLFSEESPVAALPNSVVVLTPRDAEETISGIEHVTVMMLDPWYNKGVGGVREDYFPWLANILRLVGSRADHVFLWGFPEIICRALQDVPESLSLVAWLTWYFKNCSSVVAIHEILHKAA